jgi:hypothetical protein
MNQRFSITPHLVSHWSARKASLEESARDCESFFQKLAGLDEVFSTWYQKGRSRAEALSKPVRPNLSTLEALLWKGRHFGDYDGKLLEGLGFSLHLWNGRDKSSDGLGVNISLHVGADTRHPERPNHSIIQLPRNVPTAPHPYPKPFLVDLMRLVVEVWKPDCARISSGQLAHELYHESTPPLSVGWLTYVSNEFAKISTPSDEFDVHPLQNIGSIIVLKAFDISDAHGPTTIASLQRLTALFPRVKKRDHS